MARKIKCFLYFSVILFLFSFSVNCFAQTEAEYGKIANECRVPAKPALRSIKLDAQGIMIQWDAAKYAEKYHLYRKSSVDSKWRRVASGTGLRWRDKNVVTGITYTYTVRAENANGVGGYDTKGISITYVAQPNISAIGNSRNGITIKWNQVKNSSGYFVYRKGSSGWERIANITSNTTISYIDTGATAGAWNTYTVRARYRSSVSSYDKTGTSEYRLTAPTIGSLTKRNQDSVEVKWGRDRKAHGYVVKYMAGSVTKSIKISNNETVNCVISGLENVSSCEVVVRSYWKDRDLKPHYSAWSARKTISMIANRKVLVIGDSRSYHMSLFGGSNASKFIWLAEGGVKTEFIRTSYQNGHYQFYVTLGQRVPNAVVNKLTGVKTKGYTLELAAQMKAQGITTVVYALGVNDLISGQSVNSAITYAAATMKRLRKETGCEVFFMTALPIYDARAAYYGYLMTDARVRTYNASVKSQCDAAGIPTIDAYSVTSPANTKEDGIHYGSGICISVVNMLNRVMF